MNWDRLPASRWGLRQLGVVLLLGAYAAGRHVMAIASGHPPYQPPSVYLFALIAFVCASAGGALLIHGHHLFDTVEISERWRRPPPAVPRLTPVMPPEALVAIEATVVPIDKMAGRSARDTMPAGERRSFGMS